MKREVITMLNFHSNRYTGSRIYLSILFLIILLSGGFQEMYAQWPTDYDVKANIIYRFTKYIDWPDNKKNGDFIIGIVGDTPLTDELKNFIANKTVDNRKIMVKQYSSVSEKYDCQILFVSEEESNNLKKIALRTAGFPMLLVSESQGLALKGACINFIIVNERLKLEINKSNIEQRKMSIASELIQLAVVVK